MTWRPRRYSGGARYYDVLSLERPVYRPGRLAGIRALGLRPGHRVLDVGCGTGLNLPALRAGVGPDGSVVGVDASPQMLRQARARIRRAGWANVAVLAGDAANLPAPVRAYGLVDAVVFTYSLSVIDDWRRAWAQAVAMLRPGGRAAIVDLALPVGRWRVFSAAARLACFTGGSDPHRHPWTLLEQDTVDVSHQVLRGGHVHVVAGTRPDEHQRESGG
ncbi:methyltransferase domain-containing protein [Solwaraspora sp. WMMD1047]|uniref:class I SAM-dependent methyltransferase n=1 Tax=Solwaraspora sp. WMMD1047 TaxID=3016102 RepID=UPI002416DDE5|nr:methyltransferase domain-containing protein [Solwaraspora sp. WMMD1047]MDG4828240.1 methyltransferase domain-containing protein [Solwaraspora sp. WMMD1047]